MILVVITVFVTCIYILTWKKEPRVLRPPLGSGCLPILGHAIKGLTSFKELFKLMQTYSMESIRRGGALTVRILFTDISFIADPRDAITTLNSCLQKDAFYDFFKPWVGEGLISASVPVWKKHSKLLGPTFNYTVLDNHLSELNNQARSLVNRLEDKVGKGRFNHAPYLEHATLQSICSTAMGVIMDEKDAELREQYLRAKSSFFEGVVTRAKTFWLHNKFLYNLSSLKKSQDELAETLHKLTNAIIKKRKEHLSQIGVTTEKRVKPFMDYLLEMEQDGILKRKEVQEEVDTFTFAGSDTTSVTLAIALIMVGTYPEVQRKIAEELQEVFQGSFRDVEKQDLFQLNYLEAVVKETLRWHPAIPFIGRTLEKDVKLRNCTLAAGSRCFVSLYGVNRHPSWGPDVDKFRPERWLEQSVPSHQLAAFGFGKRRCIGANFALMSMKTTLSHVLRHYRVFGDVTELEYALEVVGRPLTKNYLSIERRTDLEYNDQQ